MEVEVLSAEGVPPDCIVSLRAGHTRRQAPLSALGADGSPLCFPGGPAGLNPFKLDLLQPLGSKRMVLDPGPGRYTVDVGGDTGLKVTFNVRQAGSASLQRPDSAASSSSVLLRPESAERGAGPGISPIKAKDKNGMKRSTSTPALVNRPSSAKDDIGGFQATAAAAKEYLEGHEILPFVRALLQTVVRDRPEEPFSFIAEQFKTAARSKEPEPAEGISKERASTPSTECSTRPPSRLDERAASPAMETSSRPSSRASNRLEEQRPSAPAADDSHLSASPIPMVPEASDIAQEWVKIQAEQARLEAERKLLCEEQARVDDERQGLVEERQRVHEDAAKQEAQRTAEAEELCHKLEAAEGSQQMLSQQVNELKYRLDEAQAALKAKKDLMKPAAQEDMSNVSAGSDGGETRVADQLVHGLLTKTTSPKDADNDLEHMKQKTRAALEKPDNDLDHMKQKTRAALEKPASQDAENDLEHTKQKARAALDAALLQDDADDDLKQKARAALDAALLPDEDDDYLQHAKQKARAALVGKFLDDSGADNEKLKSRARNALNSALLGDSADSEDEDLVNHGDEQKHAGLDPVKEKARDALESALSKAEACEQDANEGFERVSKQLAVLNVNLQALMAQAHRTRHLDSYDAKPGSDEELEIAKEEARTALEAALLTNVRVAQPSMSEEAAKLKARRALNAALQVTDSEEQHLEAAKANAREALVAGLLDGAEVSAGAASEKRENRRPRNGLSAASDSEAEHLMEAKAKAREALYATFSGDAVKRRPEDGRSSASKDAVKRKARKALTAALDVTDSEEEQLDVAKAKARKALDAALSDMEDDGSSSAADEAVKRRARKALNKAFDVSDSEEEQLDATKAKAREALSAALSDMEEDDARLVAAKAKAREALNASLLGDVAEDGKSSASDEAVKRRARKALNKAFDVSDSEEDQLDATKAKAREALSAALSDMEEDSASADAVNRRVVGSEVAHEDARLVTAKVKARGALNAALLDTETEEDLERAKQNCRDALVASLLSGTKDDEELKLKARQALNVSLLGDNGDADTGVDSEPYLTPAELEEAKSMAQASLTAATGVSGQQEVEGDVGVPHEPGPVKQQPPEAYKPGEIDIEALKSRARKALDIALFESEEELQKAIAEVEERQRQSPKADASPKSPKKRASFLDADAKAVAPGVDSEPQLTPAELEEAKSMAQASLMAATGVSGQQGSCPVPKLASADLEEARSMAQGSLGVSGDSNDRRRAETEHAKLLTKQAVNAAIESREAKARGFIIAPAVERSSHPSTGSLDNATPSSSDAAGPSAAGDEVAKVLAQAAEIASQICSKCGNTYASDARFCRKCGTARYPEEAQNEKQLGQIQRSLSDSLGQNCSNCGNTYAPDSRFCRKCGQERPPPKDGADHAGITTALLVSGRLNRAKKDMVDTMHMLEDEVKELSTALSSLKSHRDELKKEYEEEMEQD